MGENGVVLEHHADIALGGVQIVDAGVVKVEIPALDGVKARDHAQQRGLAAAGGAQECEELAAPDAQCEVFDHGVVPVAFHSVADIDIDAHNNPLLFSPDGFSMKFALAGIIAYRRAQCPHF